MKLGRGKKRQLTVMPSGLSLKVGSIRKSTYLEMSTKGHEKCEHH